MMGRIGKNPKKAKNVLTRDDEFLYSHNINFIFS
jgi:hypothetical protein